MKLLMLTTLAAVALADEPQYPVPIYPKQLQWPTLYGDTFASTCYGCRTKRSAESSPEAQLLTFPIYGNALDPNTKVPKVALPAPPAPAALPVVPTYLHGVHTVASALDLKNSVPVPVGAPAPKYPGVPVPKIPAGPVFPVPVAPAAPVITAVPLPAYPAVLPVAPAAPVVVTPEEGTPVKVGAAVHPEGVLGHVERSPQGFQDFSTLNLAGTHIPVLSSEVPEAPVVPAVPLPAYPAVLPAAPVIPAVHLPAHPVVVPTAPVAPAVVAAPEGVTPVKVGAAVHPEGVLGHVERSPQGYSDFTTLNLAGTHIPVLTGLPIEAPEAPGAAAETRRKRSAQNDFYENFFALHGEYPKAFVQGPGIYGVGDSGISTVYDVRSSPIGAIGRKKRSAQNDLYENFFALHGEYPKAFVTGPGIYGVGHAGISTVYDVRSSPFGSIG